MNWIIDGKEYTIPEEVYDRIEAQYEEPESFNKAIEDWIADAIDNGVIACAEVDDLTKKAKESTKGENIHGVDNKKPTTPRKKPKPNEEKVFIIQTLFELLQQVDGFSNVEITNAQHDIQFDKGDNHYTLNLVKLNKELQARKKAKKATN